MEKSIINNVNERWDVSCGSNQSESVLHHMVSINLNLNPQTEYDAQISVPPRGT